MAARDILMGAAGGSASSTAATYVEDVFSTYLYTGTGATQTITNNIDLSTKGGLVWIKARSIAYASNLVDTARGAGYYLISSNNGAQGYYATTGVSSFSSTGFVTGDNGGVASNGDTFVSWTFRKQAKFFDIVTYTGTGSATTISHNLGSTPGMIIVKRLDTASNWAVYHSDLTSASYYVVLNSGLAETSDSTVWNGTAPTSSVFSVGTSSLTNASGGTYVAYIYASDAGGFGLSGTDSIVKCGSFVADSSGNASVTLGWEPQYVLVKNRSSGQVWFVLDTMRGLSQTTQATIYANLSSAESSGSAGLIPNATGFTVNINLANPDTYIYMAIRRGPMKTPTSGTKVFAPVINNGSVSSYTLTTGVNTELFISMSRGGYSSIGWYLLDKLRGEKYLRSSKADGEASTTFKWTQYGVIIPAHDGFGYSSPYGGPYITYSFTRAAGFFDAVCFQGSGATNQRISHSLGVTPELIVCKDRNSTRSWFVWQSSFGLTKSCYLEMSSAANTSYSGWLGTALPTSTDFGVRSEYVGSVATNNFVAYLFATCPGVSKVGSYTGSGTTTQIDCGFTAGARFVLIKRTDSTGDWYVWDTTRGITSSTDPYLLINSSAAEVTTTDYIDPYSAGFEISSTAPAAINASGGSFIYLAIA